MWSTQYDVLIVGAGIAGSSLAYALSTITSSNLAKPLRIALLERSLDEPDRIVGELLQPGGIAALKRLGLDSCLDGIDAIPSHGYCVLHQGKSVHIPYPSPHTGRSFHHGRFVQALRAKAKSAPGVDVVEATVTELIECQFTRRVNGVRANTKSSKSSTSTDSTATEETFFADLVVVADGCFSNFRNKVLSNISKKSVTKSHFVGTILEDAELPIPEHGTVALLEGAGPVLMYQIGQHETRMLVDVKAPLPPDLKEHILTKVTPHLPASLQLPIRKALSASRLRRMPNTFLPPTPQGRRYTHKEGTILLGDAWNMRHPLTGGGMTVALWDVVFLSELFAEAGQKGRRVTEWAAVRQVLNKWWWKRKGLAAMVNILSVALYDLFGADGEELEVLRTGCFKYFELGGECVGGPVSLLAGIAPSPLLLANHFFSVAFYSIWVLFTHPRLISSSANGKVILARPSIEEYPFLFVKAMRVFWTACVVFGPLLWTEIRWW